MKIVFATNNKHKLDEIRQIFGPNHQILGLADIGCDVDIPENGSTLQENALIKARYVSNHYHIDCFADDTGLEVKALDGAPGVHSARYANSEGSDHDSAANMRLLLHNMLDITDREAAFRTVIALIINGKDYLFEGKVEGEILESPAGEGGFGYDPLFRPKGWTKTFAEASAEEKNAVSHRGRAVRSLLQFLNRL